MISHTLADARASSIPRVLNVCSTDVKVRDAVNEAQRRLLNRGRWWGTYQTIQLCVTDGCLTWPRQVAHVEKLNICNTPVPVRNGWYETLENSAGQLPGDGCGQLQAVPRGTSPFFSDILGLNKTLRVYPTHQSDVGKRILFQGYDQNMIWIRTEETVGTTTTWIDGFYITLAMPFVDSPMAVRAITGVPKKDITNELVRVYEHDTVLGTDRALAIYEPSETTPCYVRSFIDPLCAARCGTTCSQIRSVTALVKLAFIPAMVDTDFLIIGNLDALELMVQSIKERRDSFRIEAIESEKAAIRELNHELRTHTGDKTHVQVSVFGNAFLSRVMRGFR